MEDPGGLTNERIDIAVMRDRLHGQDEVERAFLVLQPIDAGLGDMDPVPELGGEQGQILAHGPKHGLGDVDAVDIRRAQPAE